MRVLIVDDHQVFRFGVRHTLAAAGDFEVVGEAGNVPDALALLDQQTPDVVLMDIELPGMDGVLATREISRRSPAPRVLIMSFYDQIGDLLDALRAGAMGYVSKSEGAAALIQALRTVARGERHLAADLAARVAGYESRRNATVDVLAVLSDREREVFRLAADCAMSREIARELGISHKTVDTHLHRIHRKLGVRTAAELVRFGFNVASRAGWTGGARGEVGSDRAAFSGRGPSRAREAR
jgi:DNA-binding NarL/FixJ family response regulator